MLYNGYLKSGNTSLLYLSFKNGFNISILRYSRCKRNENEENS
jgi:hypothetical protein